MKKKCFVFLLHIVALSLVLTGCGQTSPHSPTAHQGILDLTDWDFERDGYVRLSGEWEFYPQRLLTPSHFQGLSPQENQGYLSVPGWWDDQEAEFGEIPYQGVATYRLRVVLPSGQSNFALTAYEIMSASRLWVNGQLRREDGVVSPTEETELPGRQRPAVLSLTESDLSGNAIELVLQVSNFSHWSGGVPWHFEFGPQKQLAQQWEHERYYIVSFGSVMLFIGCFHLVLFFSRRRGCSTLYFSFFCFLWGAAVAAGVAQRWVFFNLFPGISYFAITNIEFISYYLAVPALLFFLRGIFPDETPRVLPRFHLALAILLSAMRFTPPHLSHPSDILASIVSGFAICSFFIILVRALFIRRQSAALLAAGGVVFAACGICDLLTLLGMIKTIYLTPFGLLIFVSCQACALALRFSKSLSATEALSSELQSKNVRLLELDVLKDEFITNTSHELRTPLSGIIGITESMLQGATGTLSDQARRNLELVTTSGRRLSTLVNDILDFSRLRNRDIALNIKAVDVASLIDAVCAVLQATAQGKGLILKNEIECSLPAVWADEDRLQQIFFNLIGNGIKFTRTGTITITAHQEGGFLGIKVHDTGMGIAQDKLEDIFLSFEQVRPAGAENIAGTGLGLSITKSLVELHGGTIDVKSEVSKGTTFFVYLPVSKTAPDQSAPAPVVYPTGGSSAMEPCEPMYTEKAVSLVQGAPTILVVDDEPINLQVVINQLGHEGFHVISAADGKEALSICAESVPDLILLDIMMPEMSGYQVCQHLRRDYSASLLPIILVTARSGTADLVAGFDAGANDYLTKPFSREELLVRVRAHLRIKKAYQVMEENSRLKKELDLRRETELELRLTQRRLAFLLDTVDDALLATNESREICFCNKACSVLLGL